MGRRPRRPRNPYMKRPSGEGDLPSLALLEQFSHRSLQQWLASARKLNELQSALFFGFELARQQFSRELIEALRTNLVPGQAFDGWARRRLPILPCSTLGRGQSEGKRWSIQYRRKSQPGRIPPIPGPLYRRGLSDGLSGTFRKRRRCGIARPDRGGIGVARACFIYTYRVARPARTRDGSQRAALSSAICRGSSKVFSARPHPPTVTPARNALSAVPCTRM